jgi:hypothetical protein
MKLERKTAMTTDIRDPQLANYVNEIAMTIRWPESAFTLSPLEAAIGAIVALYDAFATPDSVMLQHALKGIAF